MFQGISIICFALSYSVSLALELTRFFFRAAIRTAIMVGFAVAGLLAHTLYLISSATLPSLDGTPYSSWYWGCLVVAWVLVAAYLVILIRRHESMVGLFVLPTSLALIAAARLFPFRTEPASGHVLRTWSLVHGFSLLLGTAMVVLGFVAGVMYLVQSYRLKHKLPPRQQFWFPSLEKLHDWNEWALLSSILLLGIGLVSGILLNVESQEAIPWSDPIVWASAIWLVWLMVVIVFHGVYRPSRQGRKLAYLTVGSFVFLGLVLGILMLSPSQHARGVDELGVWGDFALGGGRHVVLRRWPFWLTHSLQPRILL